MMPFIVPKNARSEIIDAHDFYDALQDHILDRVLAIVPLHADNILVVWAGDNAPAKMKDTGLPSTLSDVVCGTPRR